MLFTSPDTSGSWVPEPSESVEFPRVGKALIPESFPRVEEVVNMHSINISIIIINIIIIIY
jgi:hypothetical protein